MEYEEEIEEDARSNISSLSNTTLTDHDAEKQNGDIIHEEIDDIYSKVIRRFSNIVSLKGTQNY